MELVSRIMLEKIKEERYFLLFIFVLFTINVFLFWLKQGSLVIDTGREFYIPYQMLKGQVLYKDIFNIYAPLSYQINAFAFTLFGQKITSLLAFGVVNSLVVLTSLYFISREFVSKIFALFIVLCTMYATIFAPDLFNANIPYSYATVYGLSSFLLSLLFLIKQIKEPKPMFLYLSCFFAGVCIATKYDYIVYPLVLFYALIFICKLDLKSILKSIGFFLLAPIVSFGVLFLQGVTLSDLFNTLLIIKKMASTSTLKYFYSNYAGFYFNSKSFAFYIEKFGFLLLLFSLLYNAVLYEPRIANNFAKSVFRAFYTVIPFLLIIFINVDSLGLLPVLNLLFMLLFIKRLYQNKPLFILGVSAFVISIKTFFGMNLSLYGMFTFPVVFTSFLSLVYVFILQKPKEEEFNFNMEKCILIILSSFILLFALKAYIKIPKKTEFIISPKGSLYSYSQSVRTTQEMINFVAQNTNKNDRIVILPETPFVNFLMDRDSDNYYSSLIPLYVETFGEQNIINHFNKTRPEYIVFTNRESTDYGYKHICTDYAVNFCSYVAKEYNLVKTIDNGYRMLVYKRKDLK